MALNYVMQARENYSPTIVALFQANTPPLWSYTDNQDCGKHFDFNGRNIVYMVLLAENAPNLGLNIHGFKTLNNTGFTLWDGVSLGIGSTAGTIVTNGGQVNLAANWNMSIGFKNIDSDAVTFTSVFGSSNVPNGQGPVANGSMLFNAGNPTNGQNIVLNGVTWTFVTGSPGANQTQIKADVNTTIQQLAWDLNASVNASLTPAYYTCAPATAYPILLITYKTAGTAGNSYTTGAGTYGAGVSGALSGGLAGSDGTWRRMVGDTDIFGTNLPLIFDPRAKNIWVHVQSCVIYMFRFSDGYKQIISPFCPVYGVDNANYPIGLTTNWFFCFEQNAFGSPLSTPPDNIMHCIPASITTPETTLDKLLSYADYLFPALLNSAYFRWCLDHSGNCYFIAAQQSGTRNYKLWKFAPPVSAPWGGPVTGGGFTDVTPWVAGTGPNTNASGYTLAGGTVHQTYDNNQLMYLPATQDLVAINIFTGDCLTPPPSDGYAALFFDCTYINIASAPTFDYHHAFITGYMTSSWTPTNLAGAAYAIYAWREHNLYLGQTDYSYSTDYTKRWFVFDCFRIVGGINTGTVASVLVQYHFVSGAAPVLLQVIDESGWDATYASYGTTIGTTSVVNGSLTNINSGNTDTYNKDSGLYDSTTNSFWWSGANNNNVPQSNFSGPIGPMYYLNSIFTPRAAMNVGWTGNSNPGQAPNPPFLVLSFYSGPPPLNLGSGYFIERMDNREWDAVEDVWCVDCALQTSLPTFNATLFAGSSTGNGIPTGVTGLFGGQGYSAGTTATIIDPTGSGAVVTPTIASGIITAVVITGGTGYTYPELVFNDPAETGQGASAFVTLDNSATFQADAAVFTSGMVGSVIRMGGGVATITAFINSQQVTANITTPITQILPDTGGVPIPQPPGEWSVATPTSIVYGLSHLKGFTVTGVADGAVVTPRTVAADGSVTLDNPATLITLGLAFDPQFQSLYLDGGNPTVQGQRKKVGAVTVRFDASGVRGIIAGSNQPTGSAQSPQVQDVAWTGMDSLQLRPDQGVPPYGSTTPPLFTGDTRAPLNGGYDRPGQVSLQQTLPLPMNITAIIPESLEGDQPSQTYEPKTQREPRGKPKGGGSRGER